jgi:FkbM family methyltransferase
VAKLFSRLPHIRSPRYPGIKIALPRESVTHQTAPAIFFGFYEAAELRAIKHQPPLDLPILEIGGGLGVISSHMIRKLRHGRYRVVEANAKLISTLERNLIYNNVNAVPFEILPGALDYSGQSRVTFETTDSHLESRVLHKPEFGIGKNFVPAFTLADLVKDWNEFGLIADIEGAEVQFILGIDAALDRCTWLCLELHETTFGGQSVSINDLIQGIKDKGFTLIYIDGPVVVGQRQ